MYKIEIDIYNLHGENSNNINNLKMHYLLHTMVDMSQISSISNYHSSKACLSYVYSKFHGSRIIKATAMAKIAVIINFWVFLVSGTCIP